MVSVLFLSKCSRIEIFLILFAQCLWDDIRVFPPLLSIGDFVAIAVLNIFQLLVFFILTTYYSLYILFLLEIIEGFCTVDYDQFSKISLGL